MLQTFFKSLNVPVHIQNRRFINEPSLPDGERNYLVLLLCDSGSMGSERRLVVLAALSLLTLAIHDPQLVVSCC